MNRTDDFQRIQSLVSSLPSEQREQISDGYHTFADLYTTRNALWMKFCKVAQEYYFVWRSKRNLDGSVWPGWFLLGINIAPGEQITFHLPNTLWDDAAFADELIHTPDISFDGHNNADVLERLKAL